MPTPDKVRAIKECTEPKSKTEGRCFLGMTGYLRFDTQKDEIPLGTGRARVIGET